MIQNFGGGELLVIIILALVVLGPERIPEMAKGAGKLIARFKTMTSGLQGQVQGVMDDPAMQPLKELGDFAARPRQKLAEYALEAEADERAKSEQASIDAAKDDGGDAAGSTGTPTSGTPTSTGTTATADGTGVGTEDGSAGAAAPADTTPADTTPAAAAPTPAVAESVTTPTADVADAGDDGSASTDDAPVASEERETA